MGVPRLSAERLREWVEDPSHIGRSVRSHQPTYANPAALRRDVTAVLDELVVVRERAERLEQALRSARPYVYGVATEHRDNWRGQTAAPILLRIDALLADTDDDFSADPQAHLQGHGGAVLAEQEKEQP